MKKLLFIGLMFMAIGFTAQGQFYYGGMSYTLPQTNFVVDSTGNIRFQPGDFFEPFETLDKYIKRLERLEEVANGFQGVQNSFAIQAGREVRVMVSSDKVSDAQASKLCRDIAIQIEKDLSYPGEIKVTLIREKRVVEYAR